MSPPSRYPVATIISRGESVGGSLDNCCLPTHRVSLKWRNLGAGGGGVGGFGRQGGAL